MQGFETHIYTCKRCGDLYEAATDEGFCGSCALTMKRSQQQKARLTRWYKCERCGEMFGSHSAFNAKYCPACRRPVQIERSRRSAEKRLKAKLEARPDGIANIVRLAALEGVSYGEYMAKCGLEKGGAK